VIDLHAPPARTAQVGLDERSILAPGIRSARGWENIADPTCRLKTIGGKGND
jgi:hypothetical protein